MKRCLHRALGLVLFIPIVAHAQTIDAPLNYDLDPYRNVAPELITHTEVDPIALPFTEVRAIGTCADGRIAVSGDSGILILSPDDQPMRTFTLPEPAACLTFGPRGRLYVGLMHHVAVYDTAGDPLGQWPTLGDAAILVSILSTSNAVVVADAGQHILFLFNHAGKLTGHIGPKPPSGRFVNPSPYFDVVAGDEDTFWVANTGRLCLEQFTLSGTHKRSWGRASIRVKGFCGCCNPIHVARAPDGSFITAEKGLARIKHYSAQGRLLGVVAAPDQFESTVPAADLAVDAKGRVLILDPSARAIRIFTANPGGTQ